MEEEDNVKIVIPEKHFVGLKPAKGLPIGMMIPEGNDQVSLRRKNHIKGWCQRYSRTNTQIEPKIIDNFPIVGFKLTKTFGGNHKDNSTVAWLVQDPRGFEIELSALSLSYIIANCTIENGELLEKCVWARYNSWNVLLPVGSKLFNEAMRNTTRLGKRTSLRSVKPGNQIITLDGLSGVFLGFQYLIVTTYKDVRITPKKVAVVGSIREADQFENLHVIKNLRVSEITDNNSISLAKCLAITNEHIGGRKNIDGSYYSPIVGSTLTAELKVNEPTTLKEFDKLESANRSDNVVVQFPNDIYGLLSSYDIHHPSGSYYIRPIDLHSILDSGTQHYTTTGRSFSITQNELQACKFYKLSKHIETSEGQKIDVCL